MNGSLTLHLPSLADLGRETRLDSRDGPTRSARVASDEVETVLSLVEFGIGRPTRLASYILDYLLVSNAPSQKRYIVLEEFNLLMYFLNTFSICFCWNRPLMTNRRLPSTEPFVPNSANK